MVNQYKYRLLQICVILLVPIITKFQHHNSNINHKFNITFIRYLHSNNIILVFILQKFIV